MLYRNFSTQAELDAEYNVEKSVPDFMVYADFYVKTSASVRSALSCKLQVPFGPTLAEHLDIFPAAQSDAPILVFIHGGYWRLLSSQDFSLVAKAPVEAGVTVVVTNYALCPTVTMDEIVRQSRAAVAWIYQNASSFGGDRDRIYVSGHSAGGQLTAMLMATDWEGTYGLPADIIKGGCAISGLFDLMPFPYTWLQPALQLTWGEVLRNSPILHIPDKAGSLIVTYGGDESKEFQRQSEEFLAAWKAKGLKGEYLPQPGKNHFTAIDGFLDVNSNLCTAILRQMGVKA
ncbi:alpha/beta hydrolase [Coleofasciculus sp. FACHB-129]|uniref:alpha/beta hydrolase n=1 Tax=Cyanophyceae TaxID=3028117 RepID=UPI0016841D15|nr:alpha/beta hydrolase [Coleofasciculus sp. FACHB-129]MBD1897882.1 alpha/beta hydrolase [Coleofasciculus sp. FACHB-129]